jgi:hypothetical protein
MMDGELNKEKSKGQETKKIVVRRNQRNRESLLKRENKC